MIVMQELEMKKSLGHNLAFFALRHVLNTQAGLRPGAQKSPLDGQDGTGGLLMGYKFNSPLFAVIGVHNLHL